MDAIWTPLIKNNYFLSALFIVHIIYFRSPSPSASWIDKSGMDHSFHKEEDSILFYVVIFLFSPIKTWENIKGRMI